MDFVTTCPRFSSTFKSAEINELIVPRPRLSVNGGKDPLTAASAVEKIRDHLLPLYREHWKESDCRIDLFDCAHVELPKMRALISQWMDRL